MRWVLRSDTDLQWASLISSSNYIKFESASILDQFLGLDRLLTAISGELLSQEFRRVSTAEGPWRWSACAIYRDEEDTQFSDFQLNALAGFLGVSDNGARLQSYAVFGELTRAFLEDRLEDRWVVLFRRRGVQQ